MIAIAPPPIKEQWRQIRFTSTLYLGPILDVLLAQIPERWKAEIRLGLQEALVNAAKHGNRLDPCKTIEVRYAVINGYYWWIISDQGSGFCNPCNQNYQAEDYLPDDDSENGRGVCLLHQIFDLVYWNDQGRELRLCKQVNNYLRQPLIC